MIIEARCHCGNIELRLDTRRDRDALQPRCCPCRFCSAHGAAYLSDPSGSANIRLRDKEAVIHYRFAEHTTDFLICGRCGTYAAALLREGDRCWSALNINLTEYRDLDAPEDTIWRGQSRDERIARRKAVWTPTTIEPSCRSNSI